MLPSTTEVVSRLLLLGHWHSARPMQKSIHQDHRYSFRVESGRRSLARRFTLRRITSHRVGGILGLTASDVQLGAALPDKVPPFSFGIKATFIVTSLLCVAPSRAWPIESVRPRIPGENALVSPTIAFVSLGFFKIMVGEFNRVNENLIVIAF